MAIILSGSQGTLLQVDATSGSVPSANAPILYVTGGAIGRIGVGTTAPSAQLHVSSSSDETLFRIDGGTGHAAGTPILFVASESGSTGVGSVGINTATPNAAKYVLDTPVSGVIKGGNIEMGSWPTSPTYGFLGHSNLDHHGAAGYVKYSLLIGAGGDLSLNAAATTNMYFRNGHSAKAILDSNGQFGIGTTSAQSLLHVSGSPGALFQIDATSGSVPSANAPILFVTGGAIGRVGIGTSTPTTALSIAGDLSMITDGAALKFGEHAEVTLTHVHDTGLLLSDASGIGTTKLMFGDAACFIQQQADGQLGIDADSIINITAPTLDIDASTAVTIDTDTVTVASANSTDPVLILKNTNTDANGARLRFVKDGDAGAANDIAGVIEFYADDASEDQVLFSKIEGSVKVHTDNQEGGRLILGVASHDGEMVTGLTVEDGILEDQVLVSVGAATPTSIFHTSGSHAGGVAVCTANATLDDTHFVVVFTGTSGVTGTLPAVSTCPGRIYHIINQLDDGGGNQPNPLIIDGNASETINHQTTLSVDVDQGNSSVSIVNYGSGWAVLGMYSQSGGH